MALVSLDAMNLPRALRVLVVLVPALVACGDKAKTTSATTDAGGFDAGPPPSVFVAVHSCDWRSAAGTCTDFSNRAELELHKKMCDSFKGTFAETPCPREKLVGSCEVEKDERKRYYEGEAALNFTAQAARENCESPHLKGKFTGP